MTMFKYLSQEMLDEIPNKRVRTYLTDLYETNNLTIVIKGEVWWREDFNPIPKTYIRKFEFNYLNKFLNKRYGLKYLFDITK